MPVLPGIGSLSLSFSSNAGHEKIPSQLLETQDDFVGRAARCPVSWQKTRIVPSLLAHGIERSGNAPVIYVDKSIVLGYITSGI